MHSISAGSSETGPDVVIMPGYGAGAAFFYRNIEAVSQRARVHIVDWLGTGCSGRPPFSCKSRDSAEAWFVDSLDAWREAQGLKKMVLVGHSLGGYLCVCYALAHPDRVQHLVLVNPAGVVRSCAFVCCGWHHDEQSNVTICCVILAPAPRAIIFLVVLLEVSVACDTMHIHDFQQTSHHTTQSKHVQTAKQPDYQLPEAYRSLWTLSGALYRTACWGWRRGVTPGGIVRSAGPFARSFSRNYTRKRMHDRIGLPLTESELFKPYIFHMLGSPGSGEVQCFRWLLICPFCPFLRVVQLRTAERTWRKCAEHMAIPDTGSHALCTATS